MTNNYDPVDEANKILMANELSEAMTEELMEMWMVAIEQIVDALGHPITEEEARGVLDELKDMLLTAALMRGWDEGALKMVGLSDTGEILWKAA
jgi:hypothetical protein